MITGTFSRIPRKTNSHGYGWARSWAENLNCGINHSNKKVELLYLDHGVNFGGSINLFGGFNDALKESIDNFLDAEHVISLDMDCPPYGNMLAKRKDVLDKDWCARVQEKCDGAETLMSTGLDAEWLTIGDSHTAAFAPEGSMIVKTNGMTLNGQLKSDFSYVRDHIAECNNLKGITLVFGNIDIRHHICRINDAKIFARVSVKEMWKSYKEFGDSLGIPVEYAVPWPIEFEGRKLPKTGYYKGQPFWGSIADRKQVLNEIIDAMDELGMNKVMYPTEWLTMDPEAYAKLKMENMSSVHISPECYRRKLFGEDYNTLPI